MLFSQHGKHLLPSGKDLQQQVRKKPFPAA